MALVQRPLAAVLAQPEIARPRDLEGRRAGVTGLPSDVAVLRSVVAGDGGDPEQVRTTTIGFEAVKALLAGRVAGATAFWNVEGVALRAERPDTQEFRVDDFGAPAYPELVLCVTRETLEEKRSVIARDDPGAPARLHAGPDRPGERRHRAGRRRPRARPRDRPGAGRRGRPGLDRRRARLRRAARGRAARVGGVGRRVRHPRERARRGARVRHLARRAGLEPLTCASAPIVLTQSRRGESILEMCRAGRCSCS